VVGLGDHSLTLTGPVGDLAGPVHGLDPRAKIVGLTTVTLVAVSAPIAAWPVHLACAVVLTMVIAVARIPARTIWRRARVVLPPVLFVAAFVPFFRAGGTAYSLGPLTVSEAGLAVLAAVAAKATIGTVGAVVLGATTSFPAVLRGLDALRVPRAFTLIAAFMYRYLFVIAEEAQRMRTALSSRAYAPRHALQAAPIGRAATALFLRSYGRGERVHRAMLARGYTGSMPELAPLRFRVADAAFVIAVAVLLIGVRLAIGESA
jgi:cobalt/nickel transport system permease protein